MRTIPKWADKIQDADKNAQCVYDLCFHPNGNLIIVASGLQVLIYSTEDGSLIHALKGHKDNVYCVCAAKDGKKFASGSADKTVIIWNASFEGILKYSHNDAVQCLAYNPTSSTLASCAISDFAFWSQEQKSVQKHKSNVRINCCSWTNDGQYIALGLSNGSVSIRNKAGEEKSRIDRPGGNDASIWTLQWSPSKELSENVDILCIADWGKNLSFYTLGGKLVGKERLLGFEPLRVSYFPSSEYILVSGTNKTCVLFTKEGIKLLTIGEPQQHWVWCCAAHPTANYVAIGCQDGTLAYYQLVFSTVHSLYRERYAFRDNMTDVIIQHLLTDQKVRIKCRDLIKKIAIYKHRLAVQLPERVVIYELNGSESDNMHYRVREKIGQRLDCNLLVVCSEHLVVCQERKLLGLTFSGARYREWLLESAIRYIKVIGGAPGKEGLVLGLKNGQIWKIHINSTMPIFLLSVSDSVRCLDLSSQRNMIAIVDDNLVCHVFNIETGELLYQEHDTNSVAWNTCYEDMLCFSGDTTLGIRVTGFSANRQCHTGLVVGFTANKAFCLQGNSMTSIQLPLSTSMYQYLGKKMFTDAYNVACLGVTESDWEELAATALENLELEVARQAYIRLQDIHHLELIHELQERQRKGEHNLELLKAQVLAFRGKFKEAARLYQRLGHSQKALAMYTDLRMFDLAQDFLESTNDMDQKALIRQKADWAKNINEPRAAAEMYLAVGDTRSAIEIMAEHGWSEMLVDLGRRLDKADKAHLMLVAEHLRRLGDISAAGEVYRRLGDDAALLSLHVEARQWPQAFALAERQPQHKQLVYVPYAEWLAENDRFIEAQKAFHKAGRPEDALRVLKQLIENAVHENRYQDAGFLYWMLARQCLDMNDSGDAKQTKVNIAKFHQNEKLAAIYYAYQILHSYLEEPFTSYMPDGLFNIARFVMNEIKDIKPRGVSQFTVLYSLSKQARILGAHKLTRQLLDKIRLLCIPARLQESVEVATLTARTKPHHDPEELLPMCYRCSTYNALLSATGNTCLHCRQPFVHSFLTFEILPLVEFELEPDISDADAVRLIEAPPPESSVDDKDDGWVQNIEENQETLQLDESPKTVEDSFTARLSNFQAGSEDFVPVTVNRPILQAMDPSTVLICKWPPPLRYQYYKNCLPEWQIRLCDSCFKAFHIEDFELQVIQKEFCPFCRAPVDVSNGIIKTEELPDENNETVF